MRTPFAPAKGIHHNRSTHTLPYVLKYTCMHSLQQAHWLLPKSLGAQPPKPNKLYAIILIIYKLTCDIIHKMPINLYPFMEPKVITLLYKVIPLLQIKLTKVNQSLPLFIRHLLNTSLKFKSRHFVSVALQPRHSVGDILYPNLVDIALLFY